MNKNTVLLVAMFLFKGVSAAAMGNAAGYVLLEDIGARGAGLAGACTSFSGDITLLRYNPASIYDIRDAQLSSIYYNSGMTGMNFGSITYGQNIGIGVLGLNLAYLDGGVMELNSSDGSTLNVASEQDLMGSVSLGIPMGNKLGLGASIKLLSSTLLGSKNALTIAADAGAVYKGFILEELNAGASILNMGTGLKYLDTIEPLPFYVQAGFSYPVNGLAVDLLLVAAVDGVYNINDKIFGVKAGIEGNYKEFYGRIGIPFGLTDDQSFSLGLGYRMSNQYSFDYAVSFGKSLGLTHRISIGMAFGEIEASRSNIKKLEKNRNIIKRTIQ